MSTTTIVVVSPEVADAMNYCAGCMIEDRVLVARIRDIVDHPGMPNNEATERASRLWPAISDAIQEGVTESELEEAIEDTYSNGADAKRAACTPIIMGALTMAVQLGVGERTIASAIVSSYQSPVAREYDRRPAIALKQMSDELRDDLEKLLTRFYEKSGVIVRGVNVYTGQNVGVEVVLAEL